MSDKNELFRSRFYYSQPTQLNLSIAPELIRKLSAYFIQLHYKTRPIPETYNQLYNY